MTCFSSLLEKRFVLQTDRAAIDYRRSITVFAYKSSYV